MPPSRKLVVAGLIVSEQTILITQRRADQALPLQWELPGGKIEPGESPQAALARELFEELGVEAVVGRVWEVLYHRYPDYEVVMIVYVCSLPAGQAPRCVEVADLAWCTPEDLTRYAILPADRPLVERLRAEGVPAGPGA
jgi:8-oxo-dGTP diphosphatase